MARKVDCHRRKDGTINKEEFDFVVVSSDIRALAAKLFIG